MLGLGELFPGKVELFWGLGGLFPRQGELHPLEFL